MSPSIARAATAPVVRFSLPATLRSPTGRAIDTCSWTANGTGRTTC